MTSLNSTIINQIQAASIEQKTRQEKAKQEKLQKAEEEAQKKAKEEELRLKESKKTFDYGKYMIESSGIHEVLSTIVTGLNSNDQNYLLLKNRLIEIINKNCHNHANMKSFFTIRAPSSFDGYNTYYIQVDFDDRCHLMYLYWSDNNHLEIRLDLYQYNRDKILYLKPDNSESLTPEYMAKKLIDFLMID